MKQTSIYTLAALAVMALFITSCKPSRVWSTKKKDKTEKQEPIAKQKPPAARPAPAPPPARYVSSTPLIISPTPGFVMKQNRDGKYYHRTPGGLVYWKGYDNRFFLDSYYVSQVRYSDWEYDEWRRYRKASR